MKSIFQFLLTLTLFSFLGAFFWQWYSYLWFAHTLAYQTAYILVFALGATMAFAKVVNEGAFNLLSSIMGIVLVVSVALQFLIWFGLAQPHVTNLGL